MRYLTLLEFTNGTTAVLAFPSFFVERLFVNSSVTIKRLSASIAFVSAAGIALTGCSETESSSSAAFTGASGELVAEGASSQQNAMDYFNVRYQEAFSGSSLAYNASGSGSGRKNFIAGQVAFGGSDSPLAQEQIQPATDRCNGNDAWHLPMVVGPVAVAYNLSGVDHLNLPTAVIAKIFAGKITQWNDPAIAEANKGVSLPDTKISVIYRSDESGTSDNFQKFLTTAAPQEWTTSGSAFSASVGSGANGSNGVASETKTIDGAITYVESGFARQQGLNVAAIDFGAGPVELNSASVGKALDALSFKTEGHDMVVDTKALFAQKAEGTYPLVLTTYEIVCSAGYDEATRTNVKNFLSQVLKSQDSKLEELGYIPVQGKHLERLTAAVDAL
ncbi:phosphate ABC transporter substrate-binding protein PstS [Corynebacterium diphtheriae]|uniref:phosphate ABC transporter substrate-binding protein PstS n=1 Tax=Corynebacterium diphtheriae TaxID=1717 RepID=UPI000A1E4250|nr:phosphate ABC transporter substrate-binding protein PstS [Corynebacterium diphtheriae]CAB0575491.1 phosphate ABC transporter substrate-binding protein PstS [Corynebacterium diphtheriae]CAB0611937.1 phosphate ABC transporter substrate-binding protein PstS [Corynebacterium diphtheriae]VEJ64486.1 phosphate-binding protein pstS [Corynebacterium diphtheriae]